MNIRCRSNEIMAYVGYVLLMLIIPVCLGDERFSVKTMEQCGAVASALNRCGFIVKYADNEGDRIQCILLMPSRVPVANPDVISGIYKAKNVNNETIVLMSAVSAKDAVAKMDRTGAFGNIMTNLDFSDGSHLSPIISENIWSMGLVRSVEYRMMKDSTIGFVKFSTKNKAWQEWFKQDNVITSYPWNVSKQGVDFKFSENGVRMKISTGNCNMVIMGIMVGNCQFDDNLIFDDKRTMNANRVMLLGEVDPLYQIYSM